MVASEHASSEVVVPELTVDELTALGYAKIVQFFTQDLEVITRKHLTAILKKQAINKMEMIENIINNEDMLYS